LSDDKTFVAAVEAGLSVADRIDKAIETAINYGGVDGAHHKQWVIDEMVRQLLGTLEAYEKFKADYRGEYNTAEEEYEYGEWDEGIPP
jgi:hypothetical protein